LFKKVFDAKRVNKQLLLFTGPQNTVSEEMDTVINIGKISSTFGHRRTLIPDSLIFRLHYKGTVSILMVFIFCLSGNMWMGKPIACMTDGGVKSQLMESHCLMAGAKTFQPKAKKPLHQRESIFQGVGPVPYHQEEYSLMRHHLYKWTMLTLFIMAVCNYFPHYIWKMIDGGRLHMLAQGMDKELIDDEEARIRIKRVVKKFEAFDDSVALYTAGYVICEVFNVLLCAAQMYYIHWLFNSQMWTRQLDILMDVFGKDRTLHLLDEAFPKVVKCDMDRYGPSGTVERFDAMCFFHQNVYNELMYTLLWFWFFAIGVLNVTNLTLNKFGLLFKRERINALHRCCPTAMKEDINKIVNSMTITQFILLLELCKAIQSLHTDDLIKDLAKALKPRKTKKPTNPSLPRVIGMD
jgi:hypothetical protein